MRGILGEDWIGKMREILGENWIVDNSRECGPSNQRGSVFQGNAWGVFESTLLDTLKIYKDALTTAPGTSYVGPPMKTNLFIWHYFQFVEKL